MSEVRYMISEASKCVNVEAHVLRYWQKELALPISRNEMDQRYYTESDIELLKRVKLLKEQGFQLKAIKMLLLNQDGESLTDPDIVRIRTESKEGNVADIVNEEKLPEQKEGTSLIADDKLNGVADQENTKMGQFQAIMNHIIMAALKENNSVLSGEIGVTVTEGMVREMNYLMKLKEEKEEERFKKFDAALRDYQKSRSMSAVTIDRGRKKSKFFKKNRVYI